jgi:hypothetical protein
MLTPRQRILLRASIKEHGLSESLFEISISIKKIYIKHFESGHYFLFSPYPPPPVSIANLITGKFLDFYIKFTPSKLNPHLSANDFSQFGAENWEKAVKLHLDRWLFWLKQHYGPFENIDNLDYAEASLPFKEKAQEFIGIAERHGIHQHTEKYLAQSMFENLPSCPLTGLPLEGRATYVPMGIASDVLYTFKPVGAAVFSFQYFLTIYQAIRSGYHKPRLDLAALCRATIERNQPPVTITPKMFNEPLLGAPATFEDKRHYFMKFFYEKWGREHKKCNVDTFNDFTLASATNAEEFYRIIESLVDEGLLKYKESWVTSGDWKDNILSLYQEVMITPLGKHSLLPNIAPSINTSSMPSNNFHFGNDAKVNLVQGNGAVQTNVTGNNAAANVATGNQNTQANQAEKPVSLPELVAQLKQAFADTAFDSHREEIEHELGHIDIQLKKQEPKKSLLERSFDYLKELAIKSAGTAAAGAVVELVKHAPALLAAVSS